MCLQHLHIQHNNFGFEIVIWIELLHSCHNFQGSLGCTHRWNFRRRFLSGTFLLVFTNRNLKNTNVPSSDNSVFIFSFFCNRQLIVIKFMNLFFLLCVRIFAMTHSR